MCPRGYRTAQIGQLQVSVRLKIAIFGLTLSADKICMLHEPSFYSESANKSLFMEGGKA